MIEIWTSDEEARRLHARFDALKKTDRIGQAEFARDFGVPGGASMVSQHIKGRRPLSLEAATAYAKGFSCSLAEISPKLAKNIKEATGEIQPNATSKTPSDLDGMLQALSGYLCQASTDDRQTLEDLLTSLTHKPADERLLGSLKLMLAPKAFQPQQKAKA